MRRTGHCGLTSFDLDKALRAASPEALVLDELDSFPEKASFAIADIAWRRVRKANPRGIDFLEPETRRKLCLYLVRQFERTSRSIFKIQEFRFFRDGYRIRRFASLSAALVEYRGLARIWNAQLQGWCEFVSDFSAHTMAFANNGSQKQREEPVTDVQTGLSDPHCRGRSVTRVNFANAGDWFYKPRNGHRELAWSYLLLVLNSAGFDPPFFTPEIRAAVDHCWMRAIPSSTPHTEEEWRRFNYRTGSLLYLAHILRGVDLHPANLLVYGEHPILVDCETLFHPETDMPQAFRIDKNSLARTGLLSSPCNGDDCSFIGLCKDRLSRRAPVDAHRQDQVSDAIVGGFQAMHEFFKRVRNDRHVQCALTKLRWSGTRCIFRPTRFYYNLLREALTPSRARSFAELRRFLRYRLEDGLCKPAVVRNEVYQLLNGDIPIFSARPAAARPPLENGDFERATKELRNALRRG